MFVYCACCGMIAKTSKDRHCPVCDWELNDVPAKYLSTSGNMFLSQETRLNFTKEVIEASPLYDKALAERREAILLEKSQQHERAVSKKVQEYRDSKPVRRCPVCGSTNLSAISTVGKVAKISLLGVWGAGDLGKRLRCNSCGHKF